MRLVGPAATVQVGLFVTSPPNTVIKDAQRHLGKRDGTTSRATFDHVRVTGAAAGTWVGETIGHTDVKPPALGSSTQVGGVFTVTGSGTIGSGEGPDDPIQNSLFGLFFGVLVLIPVAVLFMTSEYRRPLILATFGASPRRRRVLAAKAAVIGAASFGTGLAAALATYLVTRPLFQARGFRPPAFAYTSLGQPAVLRAVIGSALLVGALGVLSLAVAALVRRGAATIAVVVALFVLPVFVAAPLPLTAARWLMSLTPVGGLAVQAHQAADRHLAEPWSMLSPWLGSQESCAAMQRLRLCWPYGAWSGGTREAGAACRVDEAVHRSEHRLAAAGHDGSHGRNRRRHRCRDPPAGVPAGRRLPGGHHPARPLRHPGWPGHRGGARGARRHRRVCHRAGSPDAGRHPAVVPGVRGEGRGDRHRRGRGRRRSGHRRRRGRRLDLCRARLHRIPRLRLSSPTRPPCALGAGDCHLLRPSRAARRRNRGGRPTAPPLSARSWRCCSRSRWRRLVTDATWQRRFHQWSPADAGLNVQATTGLAHLPLTPWTGLTVLAAWALAAAMLGA